MKQNGPQEIVIPEQRFLSCHGCMYHTSLLVRSGKNPDYLHNCNHYKFSLPANTLIGNLHPNSDGHIVTPSICPFLPQEVEDGRPSNTVGRGSLSNFEKTQVNEHGFPQ